MRILYLNTTYSGGGAEKVTRQIYEGMRDRGHEVYEIVCYNRRGTVSDPHVHVLYDHPLMKIFHRLQTYNRGNFNQTIPYAVVYICHFIKKKQIDLVHLNNPHDSFLGIADIQRIRRLCPVVWTLHDFWALTGHCAFPYGCEDGWKTGCRQCLHLNNYPRLRRDRCSWLLQQKKKYLTNARIQYVVPSQWMLEQVRQSCLKEEACEVIFNSLDLTQWRAADKQELRRQYGVTAKKVVLAFVAADMKIPQKGMKILAEVLEGLDADKYLLLTAGKCSDELKTLCGRYEVKDFGYIKEQEKMNDFYAMADLMVNPSVYETFGLVNIEAMASGTPVAAFPVCVMPEVISDSGGWCAEEISAESLRNLIMKITGEPESLHNRAAGCRDYVAEKYNQTQMLDRYEELYRTIFSQEV